MPELSLKRGHPDSDSEKRRGHQHHRHHPHQSKKKKYRAQAAAATAAQLQTLSHTSAVTTTTTTSSRSAQSSDSHYDTGGGGSSSSKNTKPHHGFLNEAIQAGDVGIFVTSDRGKEKAALREAEDLISQYLERHHHHSHNQYQPQAVDCDTRSCVEETDPNANAKSKSGIEEHIAAELAELEESRTTTAASESESNLSHLDLIILDIPCVSFVRLRQPASTLSSSKIDPVEITLSLLRDAAAALTSTSSTTSTTARTNAFNSFTSPRSRFIKRLTPILRFRKILNGGLDQLCAEILPSHFVIPSEHEHEHEQDKKQDRPPQGFKFKIDLTRRQSDHLSRDETIATTAAWVQKQTAQKHPEPGDRDRDRDRDRGLSDENFDATASSTSSRKRHHKVDLKQWDKMILIEAYRGLIGMSVIDVGYQEWDGPLKRGNLAEIYAAAAIAAAR